MLYAGILIATLLIWGTFVLTIILISRIMETYDELETERQKKNPRKRKSDKKKKTNKGFLLISRIIRKLSKSIQIHIHL